MQLKIKLMAMVDIKRFRDIAGVPLQEFLKQNTGEFEIQFKKKKRFVRLTSKPVCAVLEVENESLINRNSDQFSIASNETEYFDAYSDLEESMDRTEKWTMVTRSKRKSSPEHESDKQNIEDAESYELPLTFDVNKFKALIKRGQTKIMPSFLMHGYIKTISLGLCKTLLVCGTHHKETVLISF